LKPRPWGAKLSCLLREETASRPPYELMQARQTAGARESRGWFAGCLAELRRAGARAAVDRVGRSVARRWV
jgi:hypothetical protein